MLIGIIGLGSMGKRRARNLRSLGYDNIVGFDSRLDRCNEFSDVMSLPVFDNWKSFEENNLDSVIISVPPDAHLEYMNWSVSRGISFFVEASVLREGLLECYEKAKEKAIIAAPSCTLRFHPAIQKIKQIFLDGSIGKLSNINYCSGQFLPDWHTYESVGEYYVSKKETGGAREIVPFELTWMLDIWGFPKSVMGYYGKTIEIPGAEKIDDTYSAILTLTEGILALTVDVVSRQAVRHLIINGSEGQIQWNWSNSYISIFNDKSEEERISFTAKKAHEGYNSNITEEMYELEMNAFIESLSNRTPFPNDLIFDDRVLQVLEAIETSSDSKTGQILYL